MGGSSSLESIKQNVNSKLQTLASPDTAISDLAHDVQESYWASLLSLQPDQLADSHREIAEGVQQALDGTGNTVAVLPF
jgi:hypothetical protein